MLIRKDSPIFPIVHSGGLLPIAEVAAAEEKKAEPSALEQLQATRQLLAQEMQWHGKGAVAKKPTAQRITVETSGHPVLDPLGWGARGNLWVSNQAGAKNPRRTVDDVIGTGYIDTGMNGCLPYAFVADTDVVGDGKQVIKICQSTALALPALVVELSTFANDADKRMDLLRKLARKINRAANLAGVNTPFTFALAVTYMSGGNMMLGGFNIGSALVALKKAGAAIVTISPGETSVHPVTLPQDPANLDKIVRIIAPVAVEPGDKIGVMSDGVYEFLPKGVQVLRPANAAGTLQAHLPAGVCKTFEEIPVTCLSGLEQKLAEFSQLIDILQPQLATVSVQREAMANYKKFVTADAVLANLLGLQTEYVKRMALEENASAARQKSLSSEKAGLVAQYKELAAFVKTHTLADLRAQAQPAFAACHLSDDGKTIDAALKMLTEQEAALRGQMTYKMGDNFGLAVVTVPTPEVSQEIKNIRQTMLAEVAYQERELRSMLSNINSPLGSILLKSELFKLDKFCEENNVHGIEDILVLKILAHLQRAIFKIEKDPQWGEAPHMIGICQGAAHFYKAAHALFVQHEAAFSGENKLRLQHNFAEAYGKITECYERFMGQLTAAYKQRNPLPGQANHIDPETQRYLNLQNLGQTEMNIPQFQKPLKQPKLDPVLDMPGKEVVAPKLPALAVVSLRS